MANITVAKWMLGCSGLGYVLYKATEMKNDKIAEEIKDFGSDANKDSKAMIVNMLKGGGAVDLAKLREQTAKRRYSVAEENTVYATKKDEKEEK